MGTLDLNLILRFRIDREPEWQVKGAARIRVDGNGLTLVDPHTGGLETLPLARIETLSIQSVSGASRGTCEVACAAKADDKNHPGFARASCLPRCAGSNCRDSTQPVLPQQAPPARASQGHRVAKYKTNPL